ncbi:MAG: Peptidase C60 sortase A and B [Candidatus Woesebacteria bacterium GW2011_GWA2_40_7]|uniref:Peptidase C60 sortase A and B n=3 Tax=Candidatus Woeseibacteriota TaxID=1752722 RepID=A0A0G0XXA2_9BACT|nr:MAG: Peptidase C60 sortase A and B [Candidatus Woesebacteria bacterium GW2011_GWB1_39_10]KKR74071.1 MAG: Peptidase C60 sortase A and B [Candidatus Woesebacteria bacterium GW2011_GWA2_40_7]KKR92557.1 MAG: Peptidase C60 sortase A and B [Candidatus Woesebacteria bacterium GW2011_GWA1_41_13b]
MQFSLLKAQRTSKKLSKKLKIFRGPLFLTFLGLSIFTFGIYNYYKVRILSFDSVPPEANKSIENVDSPVEIIIPSIKIDLKVEPGQIKDGVWQISGSSATFLTTSAAPRTEGNMVIYGHNKKVIFGNLPYLSLGQRIVIKTKSGKIYNYVVDQKYFVGPDRVDLVSPSDKEELTIYTCYGLFDGQRAVIKARPLKDSP